MNYSKENNINEMAFSLGQLQMHQHQGMADSIARFTRKCKMINNNNSHIQAITDYEEDLAYLKKEYYEGKFGFIWPDTDVKLIKIMKFLDDLVFL